MRMFWDAEEILFSSSLKFFGKAPLYSFVGICVLFLLAEYKWDGCNDDPLVCILREPKYRPLFWNIFTVHLGNLPEVTSVGFYRDRLSDVATLKIIFVKSSFLFLTSGAVFILFFSQGVTGIYFSLKKPQKGMAMGVFVLAILGTRNERSLRI